MKKKKKKIDELQFLMKDASLKTIAVNAVKENARFVIVSVEKIECSNGVFGVGGGLVGLANRVDKKLQKKKLIRVLQIFRS